MKELKDHHIALFAMLFYMLFAGILLGAAIGGSENVRDWLTAIVGLVAAIIAGVALYYTRQANRIAMQPILKAKLEELEVDIRPIGKIANELQRFAIRVDRITGTPNEPGEREWIAQLDKIEVDENQLRDQVFKSKIQRFKHRLNETRKGIRAAVGNQGKLSPEEQKLLSDLFYECFEIRNELIAEWMAKTDTANEIRGLFI